MSNPRPFRVEVPDETRDWIRRRVAEYPWHEMPDDGGWAYGANLDYMRELCAYWLDEYDWRAHEARLNRFSHFKAPVEGVDLHYIRVIVVCDLLSLVAHRSGSIQLMDAE